MNELLTSVGNLGFPIVISVYLLVRVEGKIEKLAESINDLTQALLNQKL